MASPDSISVQAVAGGLILNRKASSCLVDNHRPPNINQLIYDIVYEHNADSQKVPMLVDDAGVDLGSNFPKQTAHPSRVAYIVARNPSEGRRVSSLSSFIRAMLVCIMK
jgi:hypothetical protein